MRRSAPVVLLLAAILFATGARAATRFLAVGQTLTLPAAVTLTEDQKKFFSIGATATELKAIAATDGPVTIGSLSIQAVTAALLPAQIVGNGKEVPLAVTFKDSKGNDVEVPVVFSADPADAVTFGVSAGQKTVKAGDPGAEKKTVKILAKSGDDRVAQFNMDVLEPVTLIGTDEPNSSAKPLPLLEGGDPKAPSIFLQGASGRKYHVPERALTLQSNDEAEMTADGQLQAKDRPDLADGSALPVKGLIFTTPDGSAPALSYFVHVALKGGFIVVDPPAPILPVDGEVKLEATFFERNGTKRENFKAFIWSSEQADKSFISIAPAGDRARVIWTGDVPADDRPPHSVQVNVSTGTGANNVNLHVPIRVTGIPVAFEPLQVQLTLVDELTAADLYGRRTADEFYVARIRFNNNLKDQAGHFTGASILAFSDSLEVGVTLEQRRTREAHKEWLQKQRESRSDSAAPVKGWDANYWAPVPESDLTHFVKKRKPEVVYQKTTAFPRAPFLTPFGSTTIAARPIEDTLPENPRCTGVLTYRPHTFEMIVNSFDPRSDRSLRNRVFLALNTIGTLASFGTSISPPTGGSVPAVMDKYANLLIPGLAKLFPSLKETQRQNIVSQAMKPIEEVPFGSDLSRVIFFPRQPFGGMLAGREVRISEICPFQFTIQVAVLNKADRKTVVSGNP
jgi:hypothetical protein